MRKDYSNKIMKIRKDVKHFQYPDFGGSDIHIEGYWDDITGKSWLDSDGNPAALVYAMRSSNPPLPIDNNVLYGKVNGFGSLVHISEIEEKV